MRGEGQLEGDELKQTSKMVREERDDDGQRDEWE